MNYTDTSLALEKVLVNGLSGRISNFRLALRLLESFLFLGMNYLIVKFIQFVMSLLLNTTIESVHFIYFVWPLEFIIEIGLSKLDSSRLHNLVSYSLRAFVKFCILFGMDKVAMTIFA